MTVRRPDPSTDSPLPDLLEAVEMEGDVAVQTHPSRPPRSRLACIPDLTQAVGRDVPGSERTRVGSPHTRIERRSAIEVRTGPRHRALDVLTVFTDADGRQELSAQHPRPVRGDHRAVGQDDGRIVGLGIWGPEPRFGSVATSPFGEPRPPVAAKERWLLAVRITIAAVGPAPCWGQRERFFRRRRRLRCARIGCAAVALFVMISMA